MGEKLRIMTENPLNAETPVERLRTWITDNNVFFKRNQGMFPKSPVDMDNWSLTVDGLVGEELELKFADILAMPKVEMANTLECSGNSPLASTQKSFWKSVDHWWCW